ncbi:MAG: hypothetical protein CM1200mP10_31610 [Candidatus Neomarinimicrobiota bacterium]|nr:MAG: hypothetical protein CM1200mP10_31610 [Candidatus Neomarinimicrobiota bacterium]
MVSATRNGIPILKKEKIPLYQLMMLEKEQAPGTFFMIQHLKLQLKQIMKII